MADVREERIAWRSRGRVARGKITIVDGDPGKGKSTLMMDWAARVSRGDPLPDGDPQDERGVLLLCSEDDPADTIRPRLRVAGADLSQCYLINEIPEPEQPTRMRMAALPTDVEMIEAVIRARNVGLVVVDPLTEFLAEGLKISVDNDVRRALGPLGKVAHRTGASIVALRHFNKGGGTNPLYRGGGSIAIIGVARFGLLIAENARDPGMLVMASTKCNLGPKPASLAFRLEPIEGEEVTRIAWHGQIDLGAQDLLESATVEGGEQDEQDEAVAWLRSYLEAGPRASAQLQADAKKGSLGYRAIRRAKDKLGVRARKQGFGGETQWVWMLPSHPMASTNGTTMADDEVEF